MIEKKKGSPISKLTRTQDLSLSTENRLVRQHNITPERSTTLVYDPNAIQKIDSTKTRWMSVCKKKEQLSTRFTETVNKQLGDQFQKEREAKKRFQEEEEIRVHQFNQKNQKWKDVLVKKQQLEKKQLQQMKALDSESKIKSQAHSTRRIQMIQNQTFLTSSPTEHKSIVCDNKLRQTQNLQKTFYFVDQGKIDREQSFQDFAQASQLLGAKEDQISMARVLREQEIRIKKKKYQDSVDRKDQTHEQAKEKEQNEEEKAFMSVQQRRYEIAQKISRAQQLNKELQEFKKGENEKKFLETKERAHSINKAIDSANKAKNKINTRDQILLDPYSDKPLQPIVEKQNDERIEINEERREAVRQNLERRQKILQQYKQQLIKDVITKQKRCESLDQQRKQIVNHSVEKNKSVQESFIQVQSNWNYITKPLTYETHFQIYDKERKRLARIAAEEGGKK